MSRNRRREQGEGRRHDRDRDRNNDASLEVREGVDSDSSHDVETNDSSTSQTHHTSDDPVISGGYLDHDHSGDDDGFDSREGSDSYGEHHRDPITSGGQNDSYSYDQYRESSDSDHDQGEDHYGSVTTYYDDNDHVLGSSSGDFHESDDDHNRFSLIGAAPQPF